MGLKQPKLRVCFIASFVALLAAYSNFFGNGFHFDDAHAVVENPAIRTLANIPRFFTDARTFSSNPAAQTYRPLVTASLALDYWLGRGLNPFWFHLSTLFWFAVQLLLMYRLYMYVLERTCPDPRNGWVAWFAVAIYGLHPVSAETVNYIIQRGDLYVALGIVAGVVMYAWKPAWRRLGLYLLPPLAAMFSKPPALVFALLLLTYIVLIDRVRPAAPQTGRNATKQHIESWSSCLLRCVPAFLLTAAFAYLEKAMTPPTFLPTTVASSDYWITQPYVTLRYFRSFFLPLHLNVDTDLGAFHTVWNAPAIMGFVFCALLVAAAIFTARPTEWRPVSFGLWWFLIGLLPTAVYPLNEVENDHRMFLPFIGLSLAVVWSVALLLRRHASAMLPGFAVAGLVLLIALAWGTYRRNEVWRTDEALWRDDVEKSPNNARGHDHLGAALSMIPGRLPEAIQEYQTALRIQPDFANAHMNLGKALAKIPGRSAEAIQEFEAALRIYPDLADAHMNLGGTLSSIPDRLPEAIREFQTALRLNPDFVEAHFNLGSALSQDPGRLPEAISEYQAALRIRPDYVAAHRNLGIVLARVPGRLPEAIQEFETVLRTTPDSAEAHMNLGVALSRIPERRSEAIAQYQAALRLQSDYPEARANLARALAAVPGPSSETVADLEALVRNNPDSAEGHYNLGVTLAKTPGRVTDAIAQYQAALRINPGYAEAHTTLGIALSGIPGRLPEAITEFQASLKLQPDSAEAHSNLGLALSRAPGRLPEAIAEFEAAFRIKPDPALRQTIDNLRANLERRN